jgi:hypothetical protein
MFETLSPDLIMFSVADQGNSPISSLPDFINNYLNIIRQGNPQVEIVMAGECSHSDSESVPSVTDYGGYNNHHAAMGIVAAQQGLTFLTLVNDPKQDSYSVGGVWSQYSKAMLLDGTAHPYRYIWENWMRQISKYINDPSNIITRRPTRARSNSRIIGEE